MTVLEFIRKNSLLVLVVIAAVGAGLIMMDYSGKGSAFSNDFYIQVNGTNYDYPETATLGENGSGFIQSLFSATRTKLNDRFDANKNDNLEQEELAAMQEWLQQHPETGQGLNTLQSILGFWSFGAGHDASDNIAVNRAVLKEEAKNLGIAPSKEQIDAYIRTMPAFVQEDGSFDQAFYQRITGFRNGVANNPQEQAFRDVISDIIIWECLYSIITSDIAYNSTTLNTLTDASCQSISGKTAWLPASKAPAPAEPAEDEIRAYWEAHKDNYKSEEQRIISLYTLTPEEGTTQIDLENTADVIMQELSMSNGKGLDNILENAANNPEHAPFSYKAANGASHVTLPLCTQSQAPAELQEQVNINGKASPLSSLAFTPIEGAVAVADYEQAAQQGNTEKLSSIKHFRGFVYANDKVAAYLIHIEAIESPETLPYEQARDKALADLKEERADKALADAARQLYDDMKGSLESGASINEAFDKAAAAGAEVSPFGPVTLGIGSELPEGVTTTALLGTASGKLCPLALEPTGARITAVLERTVETSPEYQMLKLYQQPVLNQQLRDDIMQDWLISAYSRYNVKLSDKVKTRQ